MGLITIRRATLADVKRLVPLWQEMMSFHAQLDPRFRPAFDGAQYWAQNLKSWLRDENYCVLVAEAEGELVGYIIGSVRERIPVFTPAIYGFVSDICVASHMRRQGIGTRLFATLKEWFRKKGVRHIELSVAHRNPVSRAFWRKMGFEDYLHHMWSEIE